jgi:hypothetical protein
MVELGDRKSFFSTAEYDPIYLRTQKSNFGHIHGGYLVVTIRTPIVAILALLFLVVPIGVSYGASCPNGPRVSSLNQKRSDMVGLANAYRKGGLGGAFLDVKQQIANIDLIIPRALLEQEIRNLSLLGDPACLVSALGYISGRDISYGRVSDGTFDLYLDGRIIRKNLSVGDLIAIARSQL